MSEKLNFSHRHKDFELVVTDDGVLELYLDGVLRKHRLPGREPQYVWTNVELHWEEHHYIEVRYWASSKRVRVTVNGDELVEAVMSGG